jgi:hypothetical protein
MGTGLQNESNENIQFNTTSLANNTRSLGDNFKFVNKG